MKYPLPICYECKHFHRNDKKGFSCAAFEVIPDAILQSENDHSEPYPGDGGIIFEPLDDTNSNPAA